LVFKHYTQGISRRIAAYIQKLDDEKKAICDKMGIRHTSLIRWLKAEYGAAGDNLYDCIQSVKAYQDITSPPSLDHRYVYDDLRTGLVPIYKTAQALNVKVPVMESFLKFACIFLDEDFITTGRDFPKEYYNSR
jgi:opine dehydrogenase